MLAAQVREACTLLDIDVKFYPCPKGGPTWRPKVQCDMMQHSVMMLLLCLFSRHIAALPPSCSMLMLHMITKPNQTAVAI